MRLNYNAADYRVKLKRNEELLRKHLGKNDTPQHIVWGYGLTSMYATEAEAIQACRKHAAKLRKKFKEFLTRQNVSLAEWAKDYRLFLREKEKAAAKREKEEEKIYAMVGGTPEEIIGKFYRIGENTGVFFAQFGKENGIECLEEKDYRNGYAKSCRFTMIRRGFCLTVQKGWKACVTGGLLTFYKGRMHREGIKCQWVEQGRGIADFITVSGYLVRGEHIAAKSLAEAKRISAAKRAKILAELLKRRGNRKKMAKGTLKITFADSIAAGNCRPGTENFKHKYEEEIGKKANSITVSDLRKYSKKFGVEVYAEKVINYKLAIN